MYFTLHINLWKLEKYCQVRYFSVFYVYQSPTHNCQTQPKSKSNVISSLSFWLQTGSEPALLQGCFSNPEDLSHGSGQTVVPHDPTGHHHHTGLHQGYTGTSQIQTGQHLITALTTSLPASVDPTWPFSMWFLVRDKLTVNTE